MRQSWHLTQGSTLPLKALPITIFWISCFGSLPRVFADNRTIKPLSYIQAFAIRTQG